jgi:hypothetical protein
MTMNKLAMALPQPKRPPWRPKKILDHRKLDSIVEVLPESPVEALEALLILDARALERDTQQELMRILPQIIHIRRAWKAHYLEYGCTSCRKADERFAIAARMRLGGFNWSEVFDIVAPNIHTRHERKCFENAVRWKLSHPKQRAERHPSAYGAGGFCNACVARIFGRMRKRYRKLMVGRDLAQEFATFKDALCLRYNAAQRLFNGDDE